MDDFHFPPDSKIKVKIDIFRHKALHRTHFTGQRMFQMGLAHR